MPTAITAPAVAAPVAATKRKAEAPAPAPPDGKKQRTLFALLPDAPKIKTPAAELRRQREHAARGEDYAPETDDVRTFKSEHSASSSASAPVKEYRCSKCPRTFNSRAALTLHEVQGHAADTQPKVFASPPPRPPMPSVGVHLTAISMEGNVSIHITIGGRPIDEVRDEAAAAAKRAAERALAQNAESQRRHRLREAEAEGDSGSGEHRVRLSHVPPRVRYGI